MNIIFEQLNKRKNKTHYVKGKAREQSSWMCQDLENKRKNKFVFVILNL